ncbi:pentapeptide repeat-containing protein [Nonomuraea sp. CA-141351]|uniref:pentapeptide repeat-containing protein n=1 Tax=Nonomuraea sp. CA-141351 TaxID=3239996 RepID=UPI003D89E3D5
MWILLMFLLVGGVVAGTMWWLLADLAATSVPAPTPSGIPMPQPATSSGGSTARGEILRTALAAGAGVGAAMTLALAFRRQRHQELATLVTAHDATERRITELYTKAAEQLGSDKAAVRLAGLYALERLAEDNPGHRQTIVNLICAYLRMPYTPPPLGDSERARKAALRETRHRYHAARNTRRNPAGTTAGPATDRVETDLEGERHVRLTAQQILTNRLRDERPADRRCDTPPADPYFWQDMIINLSGATLIDFTFIQGHTAGANFEGATFLGETWFSDTTFHTYATFDKAMFSEMVYFDEVSFSGRANFKGATFAGEADFDEATFSEVAHFDGATFAGETGFNETTFLDEAYFDEATFSYIVAFEKSRFPKTVSFKKANFSGSLFLGTTFSSDAYFESATFSDLTVYNQVTFAGAARFDKATFSEHTKLTEVVVRDPALEHKWPIGWHVKIGPDTTGRLILDDGTKSTES